MPVTLIMTALLIVHLVTFYLAFCRPVSISGVLNTAVSVQLLFDSTSTEPIPQSTDIVNTLKEAVTNGTSGFNLSVDVNSITVTSESKAEWTT